MRELTISETELTAGGLGVMGSIAVGVAAAYVYDKLGGVKGIEKKAKAVIEYFGQHLANRMEACQESPAACG